jgi:hypothetical protein
VGANQTHNNNNLVVMGDQIVVVFHPLVMGDQIVWVVAVAYVCQTVKVKNVVMIRAEVVVQR